MPNNSDWNILYFEYGSLTIVQVFYKELFFYNGIFEKIIYKAIYIQNVVFYNDTNQRF